MGHVLSSILEGVSIGVPNIIFKYSESENVRDHAILFSKLMGLKINEEHCMHFI